MQVCLREANIDGTGSSDIVYRKPDDEDDRLHTFFHSQLEQDSRVCS